jgi:hypothetical protein
MKAAANGDKEVIELLLNHGADPSAVNNVSDDNIMMMMMIMMMMIHLFELIFIHSIESYHDRNRYTLASAALSCDISLPSFSSSINRREELRLISRKLLRSRI